VVATIDPRAVRTTKGVDILLRREDMPRARNAAIPVGFEYYEIMDVGMFLERNDPSPKNAVHIVWTNEYVKANDPLPTPTIDEAVLFDDGSRVVALDALIKMKLTAWRPHDQVHLRDMLNLGLVNASSLPGLPPSLAARLQHLLDT
jgi:hypothetical protein